MNDKYQALSDLIQKEEYVFVDLDGTFVLEEIAYQYFLSQIKQKYYLIFYYLFKYLTNHLKLKLEIESKICFLIENNQYKINIRTNLLTLLQKSKAKKILITGSTEKLGKTISNLYPDLFHDVIGSNINEHCIGIKKISHMLKYTSRPFYIGNSKQDYPIFNTLNKGCLISKNLHIHNNNILQIKE